MNNIAKSGNQIGFGGGLFVDNTATVVSTEKPVLKPIQQISWEEQS